MRSAMAAAIALLDTALSVGHHPAARVVDDEIRTTDMPTLKRYPAFAALLLTSTLAYADSTNQAASAALQEVTVTATKLDVTQWDMPQASEIVTQGQITAQAQTSVTDVLRQQPGIQFQVGGAPGQFIYPRLRGFSDSTLYVFDGITWNGGGSGGINFLLGQLDPTMVQSIQVLRGPRATTYGANTTPEGSTLPRWRLRATKPTFPSKADRSIGARCASVSRIKNRSETERGAPR